MRALRGLAIATLICVTPLGPGAREARAQDPSEQSTAEIERQRRTEARTLQRLDAAAESALFVPFDETRRVTYAEVLENPDDPNLNFRWAQTQVASGDLTGASATLQRILLIQPDLPLVRMFYALVLFRLGNLVEADRELARLESDEAARSQREEVTRYRDQIRLQQRRTRQSLLLSGGTQHDSNRNSGPDSNQILLLDSRISIGSANKKSADAGFFSLAQWQLEHDLGRQEDRQLVAGITYFHSQQADFSSFDVQALKLDLGMRTRRAGASIHPRLVVDLVDLSRENYLRGAGIEVEVQRPVSARVGWTGIATLTHEDFDGIPDAQAASERTGYRSALGSLLSYSLTPTQRLDLNTGLTHKSAKQSYQAYDGWELGIGHLWVFQRGPFLLSSVSWEHEKYKKNQTAVSSSRRRDFRTRARLSLGVPLVTLLGERLPSLHDVVLSTSTEVQLATSNLPNFDFNNRKFTVSLTKRLDF